MAAKKVKKEAKKAEPKEEIKEVVMCRHCSKDPCACDKSGECGGHDGAPCGPKCVEWGRW